MKISGGTVLLGYLGISLDPARAYAQGLRIYAALEMAIPRREKLFSKLSKCL